MSVLQAIRKWKEQEGVCPDTLNGDKARMGSERATEICMVLTGLDFWPQSRREEATSAMPSHVCNKMPHEV